MYLSYSSGFFFFFQAEDGIRDLVRSRGLGDVYKRQFQQRSVGGQRDIQRMAFNRAQRRQLFNQDFQVLAQQWLAAGQADLLHAMGHELARDPGDLFEAEQRAVWQIGVVLVEDRLGHAVVAAEVAAVGHADAQIAQRPAQRIAQQAGGFDGCLRCLLYASPSPRDRTRSRMPSSA